MLEEPLVGVGARDLGRAERVADASGRYIEFCKSTIPFGLNLSGLRIVVDCAHGATYHVAPTSSLMLSPFGLAPIGMTSAPSSLNTAGATW